jgi:hypothetical protein
VPVVAALALLIATGPAAAEGRQFVSAYVAQHSPDRLIDIVGLQSANTGDSWLAAVAWTRVLARAEHTRWEVEGQIVRHTGLQDHWEMNAVVALRWMDFPWDRYLDTRLAYGNGLSYASKVPPLEPGGRIDKDEQSAHVLDYIMVEAEFVVPRKPRWSTFVRVHHRSGVFGLFHGVEGGSNFIGIGLRRYFD